MIAPHSPMRARGLTPMGNGYRGWRCERHDLASTKAGWTCPKCATGVAPTGMDRLAPVEAKPRTIADGLATEAQLALAMNNASLFGWEPQFYWALNERTENG